MYLLVFKPEEWKQDLNFCLYVSVVCLSETLMHVYLCAFHRETSAPFEIKLFIYSLRLYRLLWKVIHLLEIKWQLLKIYFRAFMVIKVVRFSHESKCWFLQNFFHCSIHAWDGYLLGTDKHVKEITWRPLNICFWAVWKVVLFPWWWEIQLHWFGYFIFHLFYACIKKVEGWAGGVHSTSLAYFRSYLSERKQCLSIFGDLRNLMNEHDCFFIVYRVSLNSYALFRK